MDNISFITDTLLRGFLELERQPHSAELKTACEALKRRLIQHHPTVLTESADHTLRSLPPRALILRRLNASGAADDTELLTRAKRLDQVLTGLERRREPAASPRNRSVAPLPDTAARPKQSGRDAPEAADFPSLAFKIVPEPGEAVSLPSSPADRRTTIGRVGRWLSHRFGAKKAMRPPATTAFKRPRVSIADLVVPAPHSFVFDIDAALALKSPPPAERIIDAHLMATAFAPGQIASLTVTLRLPDSSTLGQFQGTATLADDDGPVTVGLQTQGFTLLSEPPAPLTLTEDRDSAPAAFQLRIEEAAERWLHVVLIQAGRSVGELAIHDFSSLGAQEHQVTTPLLKVRDADLTLIVRAAESRAIVSSPRNRACLDYREIAGITPLAVPFQAMLRDRLRALYDVTSNAADTDRELRVVGVELARCLSPELTALLRRPDTRSVMLRHDEEFDFPLELCFLDDADDPFFIGDRIAVCRWYLGVTNPPDIVSKRVRRVAFLRGGDDAAGPDAAMLEQLYPGRLTTLERAEEVRERLFKSDAFDLIQFTGHCKVTDKGLGGLAMQDGSTIRMIDIGQLMAERQFTKAQPFVLLNACASAQPYVGFTARDSFAHRFVAAEACAFIGTLWPVAGAVANDFAAAFHDALRRDSVAGALLQAKLAVVARAAAAADAAPTSDITAIARQVAARSYCLFAHPDLRLVA